MPTEPSGFFSKIKQSALNLIFPSQDGASFLQRTNPAAHNLVNNLDSKNDQIVELSKMIEPTPESLFSVNPLQEYLTAQKLTSEQSIAADTLRPERSAPEITNKQRIYKAQQLFLMVELKLHSPPNETLATNLFNPNMSKSQKSDFMKAVVLQDKQTHQLTNLGNTAKEFSISGELGDPKLSAMLFNPDSADKPPKLPVIVAHFGNADCYENHIEELNQLAKDNNCSVIGFNVRGMGLSEGKIQSSSQETVEDAKRVLETLTQTGINGQKIKLDEIVLKGESIGSAILTIAADEYSEQNARNKKQESSKSKLQDAPREEPYVYNARSFSTLGFAAAGFVTKNKTVGRALGAIANGIMNALKINLNPGKAYNNLREDRKDYLIVKKDKNDDTTQSDDVIATFASLHKDKEVQTKRREKKQQAKSTDAPEELEQIKHQHKALIFSAGGHNTSLKNLDKKQPVSSSNTTDTAATMFEAFLDTPKKKSKERAEQTKEEAPQERTKNPRP